MIQSHSLRPLDMKKLIVIPIKHLIVIFFMDNFMLCQMKVPQLLKENFILVPPVYLKKQVFDDGWNII